MDLAGICGVLDILLVIGLIVFLVMGYKKGFITKILSIIGIISVLVFSFMYCGQFSEFLITHDIIAPSIYENVFNNAQAGITEKLGGESPTIHNVLTIALSIPDFLARFVEKYVGETASSDPTVIAGYVATGATKVAMIGIAFLILVIGIFLAIGIIKIIAAILRQNALVRFIDGALGALLYAAFYMVGVFAIFAIISCFWGQEWFAQARGWLEMDMGMNEEHKHIIKIAKWIYEGNIIITVFNLFF